MFQRFSTRLILSAAIVAAATWTSSASAGTIHEFTYTPTTNAAYNNRVHLSNTAIRVSAGDIVQILGRWQVHYGGPLWVSTNQSMGLISAQNAANLNRALQSTSTPLHFQPAPLAAETVLFTQDRSSLTDNHDRTGTFTAQSSETLYIGLTDNYFPDNDGQHRFTIQIVPEPSSAAGLLLLGLCRAARRGKRLKGECIQGGA